MKFLLLMLALSTASADYNPDNYLIDYLTAADPDKSLIVYANVHTGKITKFVVETKELQNPKAIEAIKVQVSKENP